MCVRYFEMFRNMNDANGRMKFNDYEMMCFCLNKTRTHPDFPMFDYSDCFHSSLARSDLYCFRYSLDLSCSSVEKLEKCGRK